MASKAADWDNAKALYPSVKNTDDAMWVDFFDQRPDVLHAILGDIYIVTKYDERKQRGEGRDGRRTMPRDANLDELWDMITPRFSTQPFALSVRELIGERSLRQFAAKVPMDHRELSRMMRGQTVLTGYWLEQIAKAGKVSPAFFLEYRHLYIADALAAVFSLRPNLGIGVYKKLSNIIERRSANAR